MTENIKTKNSYSHADSMRMRNAIIKSCGNDYDPIILLCDFLQHAVGKDTFSTMVNLMELPDDDLKKMIGLS